MTLSIQTLHALQELMVQDSALQAQVQVADDAAAVATLVAAAAAKKNIHVDKIELTAHLQNAAKTATSQALSDQQLEAVAGGLNDDGRMALISVFTLGVGCALISIGQAVGGPHADGTGKYLDKKFC